MNEKPIVKTKQYNNIMLICESDFRIPDHVSPNYSLCEIDIYAWIPRRWHKITAMHSLHIRRNLVSGNYEVVRDETPTAIPIKINDEYRQFECIHSSDKRIKRIVLSTKSLQEACDYANFSWNYYHGFVKGYFWQNMGFNTQNSPIESRAKHSYPLQECKHDNWECRIFKENFYQDKTKLEI